MQTDTDVSTQEKKDPETSVNTEQPIQTEEAIAPLPENVIEKNQKEVTSSKSMVTPTAVTEKSSETTTKPKAEVENKNVTETSKEVGLPETDCFSKYCCNNHGIRLIHQQEKLTKNYCYYRFKCNRINKVEALIC